MFGKVGLIATIVMLVFLMLSTDSRAAVEAKHAELLALLQGYEWQLPRDKFEVLPAETYLALIDIAADEELMSFIRGRALLALSLYENETVWGFLTSLVADESNGNQRRRVIEVICDTFIEAKSKALSELLLPLLVSTDVHIKTKAAACLHQTNERLPSLAVMGELNRYDLEIKSEWERRAAGFEPHQ